MPIAKPLVGPSSRDKAWDRPVHGSLSGLLNAGVSHPFVRELIQKDKRIRPIEAALVAFGAVLRKDSERDGGARP